MGWMPTIKAGKGPIYLAIAEDLERAIDGGMLMSGDRLPSQRAVADLLGVDLTTVTRAYAQASARGLIESEGRRGSYVKARGQSAAADPIGQEVASGMNMPPEPEGGEVGKAMADGLATILEGDVRPIHYQPAGGTEADRMLAADFLSGMIGDTGADQIVITAGAQNALHAVCGLLLRGGGIVAAGCFTYPGFLSVARRFGCTVIPLDMDAEGIVPESLEAAAKLNRLSALYVVPTNDNPTTATMGNRRRQAIAQIARQFGIPIIEDDPYGRLPQTPLPPIAAFAPELTWHIASFSKVVSPALRVGFLRAPNVRHALDVAADVHETAIMPPPLNVALVTRWLREGSLPRLISAVRREAAARMESALDILSAASPRGAGYHLWLPLDKDVSAVDVATQAMAAGLPVVPGTRFSVSQQDVPQAIRVSLGGSRRRDHVMRDLRRLDALLAQASRRNHALV